MDQARVAGQKITDIQSATCVERIESGCAEGSGGQKRQAKQQQVKQPRAQTGPRNAAVSRDSREESGVVIRLLHTLLQGLQFFAGLEAHCLAGGDSDFRAGSGIAADAGFARPDIENAEAPKLNAIALAQCLLHRFEDGLDGGFGFRFGDAGPVYHLVDDV